MTAPYSNGLAISEIEEIYRAQLDRLCRVARAIVGDGETARDVVQEAFASAVRARQRFRGEGSPEAWLWQMVVNRAISERRRCRKRLTEPLPDEESGHGPDDGQTDDGAARVSIALALLPERQRLAVFLHYYADLDYRAIGEVLGRLKTADESDPSGFGCRPATCERSRLAAPTACVIISARPRTREWRRGQPRLRPEESERPRCPLAIPRA